MGSEKNGGDSYEDTVRQAMILGSQSAFLTISRYGAGPAMPTREEIEGIKW